MSDDELKQPQAVKDWDEAFGRILDLIPRSKKALAFHDASFVEVIAKRWAKIARDGNSE